MRLSIYIPSTNQHSMVVIVSEGLYSEAKLLYVKLFVYSTAYPVEGMPIIGLCVYVDTISS